MRRCAHAVSSAPRALPANSGVFVFDAQPHAASAPPRLASPAHAGTDQLLLDIADYVVGYELQSAEALQTARYSLLDSLSALRSAPFAAAVHATRCSTC